MDRLKEFFDYHKSSARIGDIDPQNACLKYLVRRFELNPEQCYWLAFLFGCTYSAPTVFYIYNEFPDFENVDVGRLERWWSSNKQRCLFQTDRLRIKTTNKFVEAFESYKALIGNRTQEQAFLDSAGAYGIGSRRDLYRAAWAFGIKIKNFGRFTLFIYLELIHELTDYKMSPTELDVKNALSSRNGLCYALGWDEMIDRKISSAEVSVLEEQFQRAVKVLNAELPTTAWSLETSLCAFKKHVRGARWVGYYLDRQAKEIEKMQAAVPDGVCWDLLWQYRRETYKPEHLVEGTRIQSSIERPYK